LNSIQEFNRWLLIDTLYELALKDRSIMAPLLLSEHALGSHPEMQLAADQLSLKEREVELEKAAYLPKLNALYGIQTVDGTNGFYQYQVGLQFPLIFNRQKGLVQAAKIETSIAEQRLKQTGVQISREYQIARSTYNKWLKSWQYYRLEAIPLSKKQLQGAALAYQEGAIDYVTFLHNSHAALQTEVEGLKSLYRYLQAKYYLMYLQENE
jgi:cobalt-zinc-cadmium resistance protein CzcA